MRIPILAASLLGAVLVISGCGDSAMQTTAMDARTVPPASTGTPPAPPPLPQGAVIAVGGDATLTSPPSSLAPVSPARRAGAGAGLQWPVTAGYLVPGASVRGRLTLAGGISVMQGTTPVTVDTLVVDLDRAVMTGTDASGVRIPLATLDRARARVIPAPGGRAVTGIDAQLTARGAQVLGGRAGDPLGELLVTVTTPAR